MSASQEKLQKAMEYAMANRPAVGGFPFLAECLRQAGVKHNIWSLPAVTSMYLMDDGEYIINQGAPLAMGMMDVPKFDQEAIIKAIRIDQSGEGAFPEFLNAIWKAGVWGYDVNFNSREVAYMGTRGEMYIESYDPVEVSGFDL